MLRKQYALLQTQLGDKDTLINTLVSKRLHTVSVCVCVSGHQHSGADFWENKENCCFEVELFVCVSFKWRQNTLLQTQRGSHT